MCPDDSSQGLASGSGKWTAPATLELATPRAIQEGLRLLGIDWKVAEIDPADLEVWPGLYAWVDQKGVVPAVSPTECGILYIGIGENVLVGATGRLNNEKSWANGEFIHGHGLAMYRRHAKPVAGRLTQKDAWDSEWIDILLDAPDPVLAGAKDWLRSDVKSLPKKAEEIAIRLSLHLGDTVAPVNSQHAGAWRTKSPADVLAYRVSEFMLTAP